MKAICTILARGGSKGVPGKNIRPLLGKPLIAYTIEQAWESGLFQAVAVSSDSDDILATARDHGVDHIIRRPAEMADDTAGKYPGIRHCVLEVEEATGARFDCIVDLDPTSPLRSVDDILGAVALWQENGGQGTVITGAPARRSPYFNLVERDAGGFVRLVKPPEGTIQRRQDAPECWDMNASIYVYNRDRFVADPGLFDELTDIFVMPEERSVDIDSPLDFKLVELLMAERMKP